MAGKSNRSTSVEALELSARYVKPIIKEDKTKGYVTNGKNNEYFDYINNRRLGSPTHASIINNYIKLIYGLGLVDDNLNLIAQYLSAKESKKLVDNFYSFGMAYLEVIKSVGGDFKRLEVVNPKHVAPCIMNEKGEIEGYKISRDFSDRNIDPVYYPAFGKGEGQNEIYCIRDYKFDDEYFALPSFQSVLQYAELEEEISNYSLKHIKKGLAFGYIVNIPNSSSWSDEEKEHFKKNVINKLSGSDNAGAVVFDFSESADGSDANKIGVEVVSQNNSHKEWESLREQARDNIIVGHEVVSPLLFGINRGSGLSSTAEEMEVAEDQTMQRVIKPYQDTILSALEEIFQSFSIITNLRFKRLSETRLTDQMSNESKFTHNLISKGEVLNSDEWEFVHKCEVDYEEDDELHKLLNKTKLASTGIARPNSNSDQDTENIKVRYRYVGQTTDKSREFCKLMTQANKIYRKEDVIQMDGQAVNAGFGPNGADTYSIWLYKGGSYCHHAWQREIYLRKDADVDVRSPLAEIISTSEARRRGFRPKTNDSKVSVKPINMPNQGKLN